jgi:hypothetical protein
MLASAVAHGPAEGGAVLLRGDPDLGCDLQDHLGGGAVGRRLSFPRGCSRTSGRR